MSRTNAKVVLMQAREFDRLFCDVSPKGNPNDYGMIIIAHDDGTDKRHQIDGIGERIGAKRCKDEEPKVEHAGTPDGIKKASKQVEDFGERIRRFCERYTG